MAQTKLIVALGAIAATMPAAAAAQAPAAPPEALYCMRVEAPLGTRIEPVKCWTRDEWAALEVDVDRDWAKEGVRVIV